MRKLTIASLNTLGIPFTTNNSIYSRYKVISGFFNDNPIDILQLQEVQTYYHLYILKRNLPTYAYSAFVNSYWGPRGGLVIFSRFPLSNIRYVQFTQRPLPSIKSLIEIVFQKGMLLTDVANSSITLLNTHFSTTFNGDWSKGSIYYPKLLSNIQQFHATLTNVGKNTVFASGDFNIMKNSSLYQKLTELPQLYNLIKTDNPTIHPAFQSQNTLPYCIDYIFAYGKREEYTVYKQNYLFTDHVTIDATHNGFVSDHIGLQVSLKVKNFR